MNIGIDKLAFFVPPYVVDMSELAEARGEEPAKYLIGIGQEKMSINPISQDIVTLGANAAQTILTSEDCATIDMVIVGTESSIDESKASAVVLHDLLNIQPFARSIEIKEACYGATSGVLLGRDYIATHPGRKVLVIASDIARYGLKTSGEPTQGAGAVAILLSANPRILTLNDDAVSLTQDIYDFWRPTGEPYPRVDGKFSNETYIQAFAKIWKEYTRRTNFDFKDFVALAFHTPYTKMGKKALLPLIEETSDEERLLLQYEKAITYNRQIGNLYTGSLWLSLISLLENSDQLSVGNRIGLFSYGSGTVAEFFSGELVQGFEKQLRKKEHTALLMQRQQLSVADYEKIYMSSEILQDATPFALQEIKDGIRIYNVN